MCETSCASCPVQPPGSAMGCASTSSDGCVSKESVLWTQRMRQDQLCYALARHYEIALSQMVAAMDKRSAKEVHRLQKVLTLCMCRAQQLDCEAEVHQLLQYGRFHEGARMVIADRFHREFSLLLPLRGGGAATSACTQVRRSDLSESSLDDATGMSRSVTPPTRAMPSSPDVEAALQAAGGGDKGSRDCFCCCCCWWCDRLEVDEEERWQWEDLPPGLYGWVLAFHHMLNSSQVETLLAVVNIVSFGTIELDPHLSSRDDHLLKASSEWLQWCEVTTISLLLFAAVLAGIFAKPGFSQHFHNGVNVGDFLCLAFSWFAQVVMPVLNTALSKVVLMAPPTVLRAFKLCRKLWRWCAGSDYSEDIVP
eukprot:CAMPEP_0178384976 /NCGR_PEP_ID=MMETSP0689_2-20121128/7796_1 /TAXON_ID=160604 /ORGANISM="Amphidinium massartii, Strain CS-259" /LENGTH=365 /DNA_ID=CAMNT_0020005247 /DNA_START=95 /DNA_END=1188 /DNA_ORIENTATION=-